jgi:hypothetical protein
VDPFSSSVLNFEESKTVARNRKRGTTSGAGSSAASPSYERKKQKVAEEKEKAQRLDGIKISNRTARMSADPADLEYVDEVLKDIEGSAGLLDTKAVKKKQKKKAEDDDAEGKDDPDIGDFRQMSGEGIRKVMKTYGLRKPVPNNKEEDGGMLTFDVLIQLVESVSSFMLC